MKPKNNSKCAIVSVNVAASLIKDLKKHFRKNEFEVFKTIGDLLNSEPVRKFQFVIVDSGAATFTR
jgi:hypothetical protein